ncbi:hypothetical protein M427DRAFT_153881 [Gonapodya prolifera JEL478]|uniref:Uncharacterized protein n=1 Tax=Gonapodya prolifera (strain JEL478) TaxID=1344416 RepID=A0A139AKQ9_GONPJ|nr:hypothetical protein M427DRAFT_153881 [Gonapodya prolifera JEL478]|eukprot:KXS17381.1 hypothetical protein M427DRAFT_153881 [Gonapodya prolifera JEL478]
MEHQSPSHQNNPISPLPRRTSQLNVNLLLSQAKTESALTTPGPPVHGNTGNDAVIGNVPPTGRSLSSFPFPTTSTASILPPAPTRSAPYSSSLPDGLSHLEDFREHISPPIQIHSPFLTPQFKTPSPAPAQALEGITSAEWWGSRRKSWFELASDVARAFTPATSPPISTSSHPSPGRSSSRGHIDNLSSGARRTSSPKLAVPAAQPIESDTSKASGPTRRHSTPSLDPEELAHLKNSLEFYAEYRRENLLHDLPEEGGPIYLDPAEVVHGVEAAAVVVDDTTSKPPTPPSARRSVWQEAADTFRMASSGRNADTHGHSTGSDDGKVSSKKGWLDFNFDIALEGDVLSKRSHQDRKFLGEYSESILIRACEDMGLASELAKQGYERLVVRIDDKDSFVHRLTITDESLFEAEWEKASRKLPSRGLASEEVDLEEFARRAPLRDDNYLVDMFVRVSNLSLASFKTYQQLLRLGSTPTDVSFLLHSLSADTHYAPLMDITPSDVSELVACMEGKLGKPGQKNSEMKYTEVSWLSCQNPRVGWVRKGGNKQHAVKTDDQGKVADGKKDSNADEEKPLWITGSKQHSKASLRAPLPGQKHPGSGVAKRVTFMLVSFVRWRGRAALINTPEYWHNAFLYWHKGFMFLNPAFQGFFRASLLDLNEEIKRHGVAAMAWAWKMGQVHDEKGRMVLWPITQEQLYPTSPRLHRYFTSDSYIELADRFTQKYRGRFQVKWDKAVATMVEGFEGELAEHVLPAPGQAS